MRTLSNVVERRYSPCYMHYWIFKIWKVSCSHQFNARAHIKQACVRARTIIVDLNILFKIQCRWESAYKKAVENLHVMTASYQKSLGLPMTTINKFKRANRSSYKPFAEQTQLTEFVLNFLLNILKQIFIFFIYQVKNKVTRAKLRHHPKK